MSEKRKVTNYYKVLILLMSYESSWDHSSKFGVPKLSSQLPMRKPIADKVIKAEYFSDIDDFTLDVLQKHEIQTIRFTFIEGMSRIVSMKEIFPIPPKDISLMKKLGVKEPLSVEKGKGIIGFFRTERFLKGIVQNFKDDIDAEIESREKKVGKFTFKKLPPDPEYPGDKKNPNLFTRLIRPVDDSLLIPFKEKLSKCETFNDIEDLFLTYRLALGCDLINGFLRGDMSTVRSKSSLLVSFNNDLKVPFSTLLDIVIRSLNLKKELVKGELKNVTTVYRGLGFEKLLNFIGVDQKKLYFSQYSKNPEKYMAIRNQFPADDRTEVMDIVMGKGNRKGSGKLLEQTLLVDYIKSNHPIYQSKDITSTSLDKNITTDFFANNNDIPILMEITLNPGTAFGKDFRNTTFGSDDYGKEVILMPGQKIKLIDASLKEGLIEIKAETVR